MLQLLITNELKKRLGHAVTLVEQNNAIKYVSNNMDINSTLKDVNDLLADYVTDNYFVCDKCGEYVLREQMNDILGAYGHFHTCNKADCEREAYFDANNDPYGDLRTY